MKRHKKYQLQPRQLQLCLLLLLVVHIILSVILVMHPSANLPQSHLPHYYYSHYKLPSTNSIITVDEVDYKASSSRRPRVVHIDLSDSYYIVKTVLDHNSDYTTKTIPLNQYYEDEIDNIIDYTVEDNDIIKRFDDCKPMAKWQTMSYPTCNVLHEVNIFSTTSTLSYFYPNHDLRKDNNNKRRFPIQETYSSKLLGHGWFRNAWEVIDPMSGTSIAIKTLRIDRDFLPEYFDLHRRDAVAMERLTSSDYVMDSYGYCGQSVLTELAFAEKGMNNLYRLSVGLKGINTQSVLQQKLKLATMISLGLSSIHNIPTDDNKRQNIDHPATLAHYDINPRNIIISTSGRPKFNDFNVCEFLTWNETTKKRDRCGFNSRFHEPWWRAPEEMILYSNSSSNEKVTYPAQLLSEKVDIYSLGTLLYMLLTGNEPLGKENKKRRLKSVSNQVSRGEYPALPDEYEQSIDPIVSAFRNAIRSCWTLEPEKRPMAMEIANDLLEVLDNMKQQQSTS